MKALFTKRFEEEVLLSEKLRTKILAGMFLFGMFYAGVMIVFWEERLPNALENGISVKVCLFLFLLFLFELLSLAYINKHIKQNLMKIRAVGQYLNATIEITAPGMIMLFLSKQFHPVDSVLHSPMVYIYFIFIILSTLRLNFKISLFTGVIATLEFFALSYFLLKGNADMPDDRKQMEYFISAGKSMTLLLSGVGAAFVARQIRISVNRSLAAAEQENKIINLFGQQVSKEIVSEMMNAGGDVQTKLMRVCIMFIDIRNFTSYVADKLPDEVVAYQNAFFDIVVHSVIKYKGIINQFLGDGCMVTFGAPVSLENPSAHAMNAAMEIKQGIANAISNRILPPTMIGIGIHEGDAVTGNIGPMERQQYSITGSVVILASRIEQLNKKYNSQILASENVMAQIMLPFTPEYMGQVALKGWTTPLGIYKIA